MPWILQDVPIGRNIQNIECGKRNIKASDLRLMKEVFGVDYAEFFKD